MKEASFATSGPFEDYEHRLFPASYDEFYFRTRSGEDLFYGYLYARPSCFEEEISLNWSSRLLLRPGVEKPEEHHLIIRLKIPWDLKSKEEGFVRVTLGRENSWTGGPEVSPILIQGNFASLQGDDRTFAGKVRQLNEATGDVWFKRLAQQIQKCSDDGVLLAGRDRINDLLTGEFSYVWEDEEWEHADEPEIGGSLEIL
jgi:hypothetical protein